MADYDPDMPAAPSGPPPGWYGDPGGTSALRWWDGRQWTEHTQPQPGAPPQPPGPQGAAADGEPGPNRQEQRGRGRGRRHSKAASIALGVAVVLGAIVVIAIVAGHSSGGGSTGQCTTASCIVTDAKQSLVGVVAKDESVITALSCKQSTVKNPDPGVWTVQCTATYSDGSEWDGIASVLMSQNKVTWEPTSIVSGG
jgi:Protein of unknown function (DUF2510)